MKLYIVAALGVFIIGFLGWHGLRNWIAAERSSAVSEERRARTADAIELIRATDKLLGVQRKATDADLCYGMGGKPGECK